MSRRVRRAVLVAEPVAKAILSSTQRNRGQVAVGAETVVLYHLLRVAPGAVHDLLARR